jgi:hypothetical protein
LLAPSSTFRAGRIGVASFMLFLRKFCKCLIGLVILSRIPARHAIPKLHGLEAELR